MRQYVVGSCLFDGGKKEQGLLGRTVIGSSLEAPCLNFERSACVFLS